MTCGSVAIRELLKFVGNVDVEGWMTFASSVFAEGNVGSKI